MSYILLGYTAVIAVPLLLFFGVKKHDNEREKRKALEIWCDDCQEQFTVIGGPSLIDFCCPECGGGNTK